MEVIRRIVAHEMSLKDKMSCTTSQAVIKKLQVILPLPKMATLLPMKRPDSWSENSTSSTRVEAKREVKLKI